MTSWDELQPQLRRIVLQRREPIMSLADRIPVARSTLYLLMDGTTKRPTRAVREAVERLVSDVGRSHTDTD